MMQLGNWCRFQTPNEPIFRGRLLPLQLHGADKRKRIPDDVKKMSFREDCAHIWNSQDIMRRLFNNDTISMLLLIFQKLVPNIAFDPISCIIFVKLIVTSSGISIKPKSNGFI